MARLGVSYRVSLLLAVAAAASACAALVGIKQVTDDPADGGRDAAKDVGAPGDAGAGEAACAADTTSDLQNCGTCGNVCGTTNATAMCTKGACVFTCAAGYTHCGLDSTGCATALAADPQHCGACDHDCLGATCTGGFCAPSVLASGQNAPAFVAVDDQSVFWTNQGSTAVLPAFSDGAVFGLSKTPTPDAGAPLTIDIAQGGARGIVSVGTQLYWTNRTAGEVRVAAKTGGASAVVASGQDYPEAVAVDAVNVYWVNAAEDIPAAMQPAGSVWSIPRTGGPATALVTAQYAPIAIAVLNGSLYWPDYAPAPNGALLHLLLGGAPDGGVVDPDASVGDAGVLEVVAQASYPLGLALSDASVFWSERVLDAGGGMVSSAPLAGGPAMPLLQGLPPNPAYLAVDGMHIYWTDSVAGTVSRANLDGSDPIALSSGWKYLVGIALDDQYVYWVDAGTLVAATGWFDNHDGMIVRVAK